MNDKLNLLLNQINLDKDDFKYFDGGKLEKIICNRGKTKYLFCLNLKQTLPKNLYFTFCNLMVKCFNTAESVKVDIKAESFDLEKLTDYYRYFIEDYSKNAPLLSIFMESKLNLDDNILSVEVGNIAEEMKFSSIKEELEKQLNYAGFKIKIKTNINKEKSLEIEKEI